MSKLIWADLYISDAWSAAAPWPAQDMERGGGGEQQAGMNIKANSSGRKGDIGGGRAAFCLGTLVHLTSWPWPACSATSYTTINRLVV